MTLRLDSRRFRNPVAYPPPNCGWITCGNSLDSSWKSVKLNRSQQECRHKGYLCNDCTNYWVNNFFGVSKTVHPEPEWCNVRELSTENRSHKPMLHLKPTSVVRPLWLTRAFPYRYTIPCLSLVTVWMSLAPVCKVEVKTFFFWQKRYQSIRLSVPIPILVIRQQREQTACHVWASRRT